MVAVVSSNQGVLARLTGSDSVSFVAVVSTLSVLLLIFHGYHHYYFSVPFQIMVIGLLLVPAFGRTEWFWLIVACFSGAALWLEWFDADNHKHLLFYWMLVMYLVYEIKSDDERAQFLAQAAKYLLGFTMGVAVLQKTISPDYLSGDFFEFVLLTDSRFTVFTSLFTNLDVATLQENLRIFSQARDVTSVSAGDSLKLHSDESVRRLSLVVTWINYIDQMLIATLVFIRLPQRMEFIKHISIMIFIIPVYAIAPVIGFGWLIIIWGYCIVPDRMKELRLGYIGLFFLVSLYEIHWIDVFFR